MRSIAARGWLAAAIPWAVLAAGAWGRRWLADDGAIYLRVARNVLDGFGPVFNPGERVEAYTSPAWLASLVVWGKLGLPLDVGACALALCASLTGAALAAAAAWTLNRPVRGTASDGGQVFVFPAGLAIIAALPPIWDFSTSGLELGLVFLWLGSSYWILARRAAAADEPGGDLEAHERELRACAFWLGLGPLVRPELGLYAAPFLALLAWPGAIAAGRGRKLRRAAEVVLAALAVPLAYEIFRMGYFATLVSNTALVKEAFGPNWGMGFAYVTDFVRGYHLEIPFVLGAVLWARGLSSARLAGRRATLALMLVMAVSACTQVIYVVRLGGDFMHARMLLPPLFAAAMPIALVTGPARGHAAWHAAIAVALFAWALSSCLVFRPVYPEDDDPKGIVDERCYYVRRTHVANPVLLADFEPSLYAQNGIWLNKAAQLVSPRRLCLDVRDDVVLPPYFLPQKICCDDSSRPSGIRVVAPRMCIGVTSCYAGPLVHVLDRYGLADPLCSRIRLKARGRPGHEKKLPNAWIYGRFLSPGNVAAAGGPALAAHRALAAGELAELLEALEAPLTFRRFCANLAASWRLTRLRFEPSLGSGLPPSSGGPAPAGVTTGKSRAP